MRALIIAFAFLVGCGSSDAAIIFSDASIDCMNDSVVDVASVDVFFDYCYKEIVDIAREAEKCTTNMKDFWEYMKYIESLPCDDIRSGNYDELC